MAGVFSQPVHRIVPRKIIPFFVADGKNAATR